MTSFKAQVVSWKKSLYFIVGIFMLGCGIVGMVLPVMPTTIFFILALACFSRSSARMRQWLLNHPKFGHNLTAWTKYQVVPKKAKYWATASMLVSFIIVALTVHSATVIWLMAYTISLVIIYLLSKPSSIEAASSPQHTSACFKPWPIAIFTLLFLAGFSINCPYLVQPVL